MNDIEFHDVVARIWRAKAETDKFVDERGKLRSEGRTFERERATLLMTRGAAILGAGAVLAALRSAC